MNETPETGQAAIEIDSKVAWDILCFIEPHFKELSFEDNLGRFVVLDYLGSRWSIWTPQMIAAEFDHIAPTRAKLKFVSLVK